MHPRPFALTSVSAKEVDFLYHPVCHPGPVLGKGDFIWKNDLFHPCTNTHDHVYRNLGRMCIPLKALLGRLRHSSYDDMAIPCRDRELLPTADHCAPLPLPFFAAECHSILLPGAPYPKGAADHTPHVG